MVFTKTTLPQDFSYLSERFASSKLKASPRAVQFIGPKGSGARYFVFDYVKYASRVAWIQTHSFIYAPSLWALASPKNIHLTGIICPNKNKLRQLIISLTDQSLFDTLVFDSLNLSPAEGRYLQQRLEKLLFPQPDIIVLDSKAHAFCRERFYCSSSHNRFRCSHSTKKTSFKEIPFL